MAKLIVGVNDLLSTFPDIAKEWNYEKNGELLPSGITAGSSRKVWWKCSICGYEWSAVVYSRKNGSGCPICKRESQALSFRKKRIERTGSLVSTHPQLCQEWNYKKNYGKKPDDFSYGSNQKVWWICSYGHEWEASINSRVRGTNCPTCNAGMRMSLPEKAIVYYLRMHSIELVENARIFTNSLRDVDIFIPSANMAIEYDGERWHQNEDKDLDKTKLCKDNGIKLVRIREPGIGLLNDGYSIEHITETPKNDLSYVNESIEWLLQLLGQASVDINANRDMPQIKAMIKKTYEEESFGKQYPDLISDWDSVRNGKLSPNDVSKSSGVRVWWKCKLGHSWQDTIAHRIAGRGCPFCSGRRTLPGFNDLQTKYPQIADEWDYTNNKGLLPSNISYRNGRKVWWICPKGHSYTATVAHRTEDNTGCPFCANQKVLIGYNDLLSTNPTIANEWNYEKNKGMLPTDFVANSNKKVWWKCKICGNEWRAIISSRTIANAGCPICSRKKAGDQRRITATKSRGSILENHPELAQEWHPIKNGTYSPCDFSPGSNFSVWWKCKICGYEWKSKISNRTILQRGCPKCAINARARRKNKAVRCVDIDKTFDSVNSAAIFSEVSASKISACCRGKQKTAGGYHWEYIIIDETQA